MNPIQPVGDSAAGVTAPRADRTAEMAGTSQAKATQVSTAMEVSSTLNVTMVYSQVDAMLSNVGGGVQDNKLLRMLIALMIMQALLAQDGGNQQSGANALMDLLGLSGGIDSALSAVVAVDALGAERVRCVMLPSRYTSQESLEDAATCAELLGLDLAQIPINSIVDAYDLALRPFNESREPGVMEENIQARARGVVLMAISNKLGHMVLTTGNKSEISVVYATLYGDMSGALAPIGDLSKSDVYALCHHLNAQEGRELIPRRVLEKAPSAELRANQVDPFDYAVVSPLVDELVLNRAADDDLVVKGYDQELIRHVRELLVRAEHKRRQAAPTIRVTGKAFGSGWRYPIVNRYDPDGRQGGD